MSKDRAGRREFLKSTIATAGFAALASDARAQPAPAPPAPVRTPRLEFAVIGVNHPHVHRQIEAVGRGGGALVAFYAKEPELAASFAKRYPQARLARSEKEILESGTIKLVASAGIPVERAPLGIEVMRHGKDFVSDKPGMISLQQLAQVRRVQAQTKRIYSILYSERHENRATVKAGELVKAGAIGKVIQTIGLGPHRLSPKTRAPWFFDKARNGGIITDVGSHQFDQFLFFTGSRKAQVVAAQVRESKEHPGLEDFGDVLLHGDAGTGYIRVDWFTPDGLATWGDGRLTVLGSDGFIEVRKNIDLAGHPGPEHLFLVDQKGTRYFDCKNEPLPYGERLVDDVLNRTETAMPQEHCFLAMELALKAQAAAKQI
jgi:predicted dehydrogenase